MPGQYILAHDLGTTGNKASLYDRDGRMVASSFFGYGLELPHVNWVEQNPEDWWQAVCASTRQLLAAAKVQPKEIACITFSGQMMGCVVVDRRARPLRNALIWADIRAVAEAQTIIDGVGMAEAYRITGHRASSSYSGAKILWVRNHQPEIFAQAHKFLHAKDFIVARLTGNFVTDYSDASGMNLYDLQAGDWSDRILDAIGLDRAVLPELHASTDVVGAVTADVAEEVGLAAGTPVVIGGGDGCCAATGAGVVREGSAYNYIGSSSWIALATKAPILDPTMRTFTWAHLVPGMFSPCGTMQAAGGSYQWLRDNLCQPEKDAAAGLNLSPYELMNLQAESSPPGANGLLFLPYLLGERSPRWNPKARRRLHRTDDEAQPRRHDPRRAGGDHAQPAGDPRGVPGAGRAGGGDAGDRRRRARPHLAADHGRHLRDADPAARAAGGSDLDGRGPGRRRRRGHLPRFQRGRTAGQHRGHDPAEPGAAAGVRPAVWGVQPGL